MEYTETEQPATSAVVVAPKRKKAITKKAVFFAIITLLLIVSVSFAGTAYVASDTLPDDTLYDFKTSVVEELVAFTKLNSESRSGYAVTRLEHRLRELQLLAADTSTTSEDTLNQIKTLIEQHASVIEKNTNSTDVTSVEATINSLAQAVAITRAQEILIEETAEFANITPAINSIEENLDDRLRSSIDTLASSTDTALMVNYIQQRVTEVAERLPLVANGSRAQRVAQRRIDDTNEAILDNQFSEALYYIMKAKEAIAIDQYLYAAERGFVDGITEEAGPIPEGS